MHSLLVNILQMVTDMANITIANTGNVVAIVNKYDDIFRHILKVNLAVGMVS